MLSYVETIPNTAKLQKWKVIVPNYDEYCDENDKKCWVTFKPFQTQQNYKSDQITMKTIKNVEYVQTIPNTAKLFQTQQNYKTTKVIKI